MNVLHICTSNIVYNNGHKTRIFSEFIQIHFNNTTIKYHLIAFENNEVLKSSKFVETKEQLHKLNVKYKFIQDFSRGKNLFYKIVALIYHNYILYKHCKTMDINIIYCHGLPSTLRSILCKILLRLPLIFEVHGVYIEENYGDNPYKKLFLKIIRQKILNFTDINIYTSNSMMNLLKKNIDLSKDKVISAYLDTSKFNYNFEDRLQIRKKLNIEDKFVFLFLGTFFEKWQEASMVVTFFRNIKDIISNSLLMIISSDKKDNIHQFLTSNGYLEKNFLIYNLNHQEVAKYIKPADIGLLFRRKNVINETASPIKFGEYLGCGVPVLLTEKIGDVSDLVKKNNLGLVLESNKLFSGEINYSELANRIINIKEFIRPEKCSKLAKKYFSMNNYKKEIKRIYSNWID